MGVKIDPERVTQLKQFVALCRNTPAILNSPDLAFFKEWLERYVRLLEVWLGTPIMGGRRSHQFDPNHGSPAVLVLKCLK